MQTNAELLQAVLKNNDPRAFSCLVLRYERLVWSTIWPVLHDYHLTQDVTQETFVKAHQHLGDLKEPETMGFWLCQIARREALRVSGRRDSAVPLDRLEPEAPIVDRKLSEVQQELIDLIGRLPEHEREVIALRYLDGHSVANVAELSGLAVGTVTKKISRAIRRLQDLQHNERMTEPAPRVEQR